MNTRELMELAIEPFRSRTDYILALLDGTNGVREAVKATALEMYCYSCREWRDVSHVHAKISR